MTDETGLAAALAASYLTDGHHEDEDPDFDRMAAAVLDRLADPATVEAVARALVLATEDDCDGYLPLTAVDVSTLAVTRREEATAALAVVRGLLGGTGGEG